MKSACKVQAGPLDSMSPHPSIHPTRVITLCEWDVDRWSSAATALSRETTRRC